MSSRVPAGRDSDDVDINLDNLDNMEIAPLSLDLPWGEEPSSSSSSFLTSPLVVLRRRIRRCWYACSSWKSTVKPLWMLVPLAAFVIIIGIVVANNASKQSDNVNGKSNTLCLTPACIQLSAEVISTVDANVDPCEDFYAYACNGFLQKNPIPEDKSTWVSFNVLAESNRRLLKSALAGKTTAAANANVTVTLAKEVFASCMDEDAVESRATAPLQPLLEKVDISAHGVSTAVANAHSMGISALFSLGVGVDDKHPTKNAVFLSQGGLGLPSREYYLEEKHAEHREFYVSYVEKMLTLAGAKFDNVTKVAEDVLKLETELARAHYPRDKLRDPMAIYNLMDVASLSNSSSPSSAQELSWNNVIAAQVKLAGVDAPNTIVVSIPAYPGAVNELLSSRADDHTSVQAYLSAHVAMKATPLLGKAFSEVEMEYRKAIYGIDSERPRWERCVGVAESVLGFAVGKLFADTAFSEQANVEASDDVDRIRKSFEYAVPKASWMDEPTRERALNKAAATRAMIGLPAMVMNQSQLREHYAETIEEMQHVTDRSANLLESVMAGNLGSHRRAWAKLAKPVDRSEWDMLPQEVNAYYDPSKNEIVFPAGILQPPFFRAGAPRAANLGGIGVVVGHELSHGFDDEGRQYDADGTLRNWWSEGSEIRFRKRAQCITKQYSQFVAYEGGGNVNGNLTLGENLADNVGLHLSYEAYRRWRDDRGDDLPLPVDGLTNDRLFFLSFARVWCGATRPEAAERRRLTDPHSPSKWRVIGTLQNSKDFARAYQCKAGTKMNPSEKCDVY